MKKLHEVRGFLLEAMPEYTRDPDKFATFVEDGSIEFHRGESLSHGYTYTAQIVLLDFERDVDHVVLPLLMWLQRYQPDVEPREALTFEAEILADSRVDLIIRVRLDERVTAKADTETGNISVEHRAPEFDLGLPPKRAWQLELYDQPEGATWTI